MENPIILFFAAAGLWAVTICAVFFFMFLCELLIEWVRNCFKK